MVAVSAVSAVAAVAAAVAVVAAVAVAVLVVLPCVVDGAAAGNVAVLAVLAVLEVGAPCGNNQICILSNRGWRRILTSHGDFPFGETRLISERLESHPGVKVGPCSMLVAHEHDSVRAGEGRQRIDQRLDRV